MQKRTIEVYINGAPGNRFLGIRIECEHGSIVNSVLDPINDSDTVAFRYMIEELRKDKALNRAVNLILPEYREIQK